MSGRRWQQELEVTGLIGSAVRKLREMNAGAQFTFSILDSQGSQPREWYHPVQAGPSPQLTYLR